MSPEDDWHEIVLSIINIPCDHKPVVIDTKNIEFLVQGVTS